MSKVFLSEHFKQSVENHRNRVALVDERGQSWTYEALGDEVERLAGRFRQLPGDTVGILLLNSQRYVITMLALWVAGKTAVPLNYLLPPADLGFILKDSGMGSLVASGFFEEALEKVRPLFGDRGSIVMADDEDFIPASVASDNLSQIDPALFLYTSGTTGRPKGVVLSHQNLIANFESCKQAGTFTSSDSFLCLLPFFHTYAITGTILLPLLTGSKMVLVDRFHPLKVLQLIEEHKITCFLAIPSMYRVLASTEGDFNVDSVRFPISGGEPMPVAIAEAFAERFSIDIFEGYGQTEASPVVSLNTPGARKLGTVGKAVPGVEVVIWDKKNRVLPNGEIGEVMVRGKNVMEGYYNLEEETAKTISGEWLHTGDLGTMDNEGFLSITGRIKELIISAGENIYPREIEEVLVHHPAVKEVAVIGVPDEVRGEVPKAFVIVNEGTTTDEKQLKAFCRDKLANYKIPKKFEIVEDFPRNPTGKVLKRMLG